MEIGGISIPIELIVRVALLGAMVAWAVRTRHRVHWSMWRFIDDYGSWVTVLTLAYAAPYALWAVLLTGRVDLSLRGAEAGIFWLVCACTMRLMLQRMWVNWTTLPNGSFAE